MGVIAAPAGANSATDTALVEAVRSDDDLAFEELYRRYHPRVHAFIRRRVRDEGRAEDLTQEAFFSALRRLRTTDSDVAFRPWIYEIARNATIDHFRRHARAEEVSVDSVDGLRQGDHLRLVGDNAPHAAVVAKQQLDALQGAFGELSRTHERILVLRELEGLSYREIGERMEMTRPGVESTLFRARRRLAREYSDLQTGRRCLAVHGAMARMAEERAVRGDRGRVARHVRRCSSCRATARELALEAHLSGFGSRVAALLPLPAFLMHRLAGSPAGAAETTGALGAKGAAIAAAALTLAGGGFVAEHRAAGPGSLEPPVPASAASVSAPHLGPEWPDRVRPRTSTPALRRGASVPSPAPAEKRRVKSALPGEAPDAAAPGPVRSGQRQPRREAPTSGHDQRLAGAPGPQGSAEAQRERVLPSGSLGPLAAPPAPPAQPAPVAVPATGTVGAGKVPARAPARVGVPQKSPRLP